MQTTTQNQLQNTTTTTKAINSALTDAQMSILRTQIAPDISDNDLLYCLEVANNCQLNPILKDIYFVPRKAQINNRWITKHEPMVGRKGARAIARRKGMKIPPNTGHKIKKFPKFKNGTWIEELDLVGWAELLIDGQIVRKEAAFSVFKQTKKDGSVTKFWNDMPTVMVEKVAEFQLLDAVYGLDGVMSIDAGILVDDEPIVTNVNVANKDEIIAALEQLGLDYSFVDDSLVIRSSSMQHSKTLKKLGFGYYNNQWQIRVAIETQQTEEATNVEVKATPPARELFNFLLENGLDSSSAGKFVREVLGLNSKDKDGCELALENKDIILKQINQFLNSTLEVHDVDENKNQL